MEPIPGADRVENEEELNRRFCVDGVSALCPEASTNLKQ